MDKKPKYKIGDHIVDDCPNREGGIQEYRIDAVNHVTRSYLVTCTKGIWKDRTTEFSWGVVEDNTIIDTPISRALYLD